MIPRTKPSVESESWQIALKSAIRTTKELLDAVAVAPEQIDALDSANLNFPVRVPRSFAQKMEQGNPKDPLLLQCLPLAQELLTHPDYVQDPLQENDATPAKGIIHKYQSRVLLISTSACAIHCRYCFRRHFPYQDHQNSIHEWQQQLQYLHTNPNINEVILSGGDPLSLTTERLHQMVQELEQIPHLQTLRIHTRFPIVIPQRLNTKLLQLFSNSRFKTVIVVHANHPKEIDDLLIERFKPFTREGILLLNQSVLLRDVNDDSAILGELSQRLFQANILPYYLHQLDKVAGAHHFAVTDQKAIAIHEGMNRRLPGYLVPKLVRELPGKDHKTTIIPTRYA